MAKIVDIRGTLGFRNFERKVKRRDPEIPKAQDIINEGIIALIKDLEDQIVFLNNKIKEIENHGSVGNTGSDKAESD